MLRAGKWISTRDLVGFGFLEITNRAAASCLLSFSAAEKTILNFIKPLLQMIGFPSSIIILQSYLSQ